MTLVILLQYLTSAHVTSVSMLSSLLHLGLRSLCALCMAIIHSIDYVTHGSTQSVHVAFEVALQSEMKQRGRNGPGHNKTQHHAGIFNLMSYVLLDVQRNHLVGHSTTHLFLMPYLNVDSLYHTSLLEVVMGPKSSFLSQTSSQWKCPA